MCSSLRASEDGAHDWAEQWMGDLNCPLCGSAYEADQLHPIRKGLDHWVLSVQCFCCGTGSLITTPAFSEAEPAALSHEHETLPPFSIDDVLDWHRLLQQFQGDWIGLWMALRHSA